MCMFGLPLNFWLIQLIGIAALALTGIAYQGKTRHAILSGQLIGALFFGVHFLLLGAYTGALMNLIIALRNFVFEEKDHRSWANHAVWPPLFMALAAAVLALTWQGPISLLPVIATIIATYALWSGKPAFIRELLLFATLLWMPYTLAVGSYAGTITQIVMVISLLFGIARRDHHWIRSKRWHL